MCRCCDWLCSLLVSVVLSGVHESISPNQSSAAQDQVNPIDVERRVRQLIDTDND